MKRLLLVSAIIEVLAGVALVITPSLAVYLALNATIAVAVIPAVRLGGAGLFALGVACWFAREDAESRAARGVAAGMLAYNVGAVSVLASAPILSHSVGVALWPAVVLHVAMAVWCIALLRRPARR